MEQVLPPFDPNSGDETLILIAYTCTVCSTQKTFHQRYPREPGPDFRQWCWNCRMLMPHTRHILGASAGNR